MTTRTYIILLKNNEYNRFKLLFKDRATYYIYTYVFYSIIQNTHNMIYLPIIGIII